MIRKKEKLKPLNISLSAWSCIHLSTSSKLWDASMHFTSESDGENPVEIVLCASATRSLLVCDLAGQIAKEKQTCNAEAGNQDRSHTFPMTSPSSHTFSKKQITRADRIVQKSMQRALPFLLLSSPPCTFLFKNQY